METPLSHLPNPSRYTLTVGEASDVMQLERCKFASVRKVQRLCREGFVDCHKLTTTRNGQPVTEWLVNETSLRKRIEEHEPRIDDGVATVAPDQFGGANFEGSSEFMLQVLALPVQSGAAKSEAEEDETLEDQREDMTTPEPTGVASLDEPSKASLMIDNARLTAELEGAKLLVAEILDDKGFLREELRDAREGRKDVTKIAERMLEALETMALGGKLQRLQSQEQSAQNPIPPQAHQPTGGDIHTTISRVLRYNNLV